MPSVSLADGTKDFLARITIIDIKNSDKQPDSVHKVKEYVDNYLKVEDHKQKAALNKQLTVVSGIRNLIDFNTIRNIQKQQFVMVGGRKKATAIKVEEFGHGFTELQVLLKGDAEEM